VNRKNWKNRFLVAISVMATVTLLLSACGSGNSSNSEVSKTSKETTSMENPEAEKSLIALQTDLASVGGWLYVYGFEEQNASAEEIRESVAILERRVKKRNPKAAVHQDEIGRIVIELPGLEDASELLPMIEARGTLYFIRQKDDEGNLNFSDNAGIITLNKEMETLLSDGSIPLTGADVARVETVFSSNGYNENEILLELSMTEEGKEKLQKVTQEAYQNDRASIAICFDGEILYAPRVQQPILDGRMVITGLGSNEKTQNLADILDMGELKVTLKKAEEKFYEIPQNDKK